MSKSDTWITRDPGFNFFPLYEVTAESWSESVEGVDPETGPWRMDNLPILIDEVRCSHCETAIGWDSEQGFNAFWTDDQESVYLCESCAIATEAPMIPD